MLKRIISNKRLRIPLTYCALTVVSSAFSATLSAETLQDIYQQALQNDHQYRADQAQHQADSENEHLGRGALLPQISAEASWFKSQISDRSSDQDHDREQKAYSVGLSQALVDLNAWSLYRRGQSLTNVADAELVRAQQSLILRTASAYFEALQAVDNAATARAEEEALKQQLEQARQRFEVGLTAITEVHEAQAAYDSANANRLVTDGNLEISFEALEVLTGKSHESLAPLKDDFPVVPPAPLERDQWEDIALENNASLQVAWHSMRSAKAFADAQKNRHLPTLYGSVSYGANRLTIEDGIPPDLEGLPPSIGGGHDHTTRYGVTLSVPLFTGGNTSAGRRQSYSQYLVAQELHSRTQRDIVQSTRTSHLAVLTTAATVKARQQAIISNRSALDATQAGYDVGTRDLVDVLNAQRNLYRAQRDYYDSLYTYVLATLQLREAAGILAAEDIAELNQWLDESRSIQRG